MDLARIKKLFNEQNLKVEGIWKQSSSWAFALYLAYAGSISSKFDGQAKRAKNAVLGIRPEHFWVCSYVGRKKKNTQKTDVI